MAKRDASSCYFPNLRLEFGLPVMQRPHALAGVQRTPAADHRDVDLLKFYDLPHLFRQAHRRAPAMQIALSFA